MNSSRYHDIGRLRWIRPLPVAVGGVILVMALVGILVSLQLSYCPISVTIKDVSPAEMLDAKGKRMWQITLTVANSQRLLFRPDWLAIDAKGPDGWATVVGHCSLMGAWPDHTSDLVFVVPTGTTHFRIQLGYQREMLKWRMWNQLGQRGRTLVTKYAPGVSASVWPLSVRSTFHQPPYWKHAIVVSPLPGKVILEPH
jgi:hypothetical protein